MKAKDRSIKTSRNHKRQLLARSGAFLLGLYFGATCELVLAGPTGGEVVRGEGSIGQAGLTTTIQQQSHRLSLQWQTFNVASNENVIFNQPGTTAVALNRILDQNASEILGAIDANGRVFLINPNGIIFGSTATVNVGSLVASSLNIDYDDFMAGDYDFQTLADGSEGVVVNRGLLQASAGGSITLMGDAVSNEGLILAELGQVTLAAGSSASLDFSGDGLLFFEVTGEVLENTGVLDSAVSNSGEISADGGQVLLTASTARDVFTNVVNNDGIIRAQRIDNTGGVIRLVGEGGSTISSGVVDASGEGNSGGGNVQLLGDRVTLAGGTIDTSGALGGGDVYVGGGFQGSDPEIANAEATYVGADASINADATIAGDGGQIVVWSDGATEFHGTASARGGSIAGDGGLIEVSGKEMLTFTGSTDRRAPAGQSGMLLLDPTTLDIVSGAAGAGEIQDSTLVTELDGGPVTLQTSGRAEAIGTGDGIITFMTGANVTWTSGEDLTLIADDDGATNIQNGTVTIQSGVTLDGSGTDGGGQPVNIDIQAGTVNLASDIVLNGVLTGTADVVQVSPGAQIQDGINVAAVNAAVNVLNGTYVEDLSITTDGLQLVGESNTATIIQGVAVNPQTSFPLATPNIDIQANDVTISDFTIRSPDVSPIAGVDQYASGIVLSGSGITIDNNNFEIVQTSPDTTVDGGGNTTVAIQTWSGALAGFETNTIDGLRITNNSFSGTPSEGYYGVYVNPQGAAVGVNPGDEAVISTNIMTGTIWRGISTQRSNTQITNNQIATDTNFGGSNSGIMITNFGPTPVADVTISGNTIAGSGGTGFGDGLRLGFPTVTDVLTNLSVTGNTVSDADVGANVHSSAATITLTGNTFQNNPTQVNSAEGASAFLNTAFANNTFDLSAVASSGTAIFSSIQAAIDDATAADTVLIGPGLYVEQLVVDKALTLTGADDPTGATANDAPDTPDAAIHSIVQPDADPTDGVADVAVDASGTTIQNIIFDFNGAADNRGGLGLFVSDLGDPPVTGVTITNNQILTGDGAGLGGTGIQTGQNSDVSNLSITGNYFFGDATGFGEGVYINEGPGTNISVTDNRMRGLLFSGVSVEADSVTVSGNNIASDSGTGITGIRFIDLVGAQTYSSTLTNNTIDDFQTGIRVGNTSAVGSTLTATVTGNTLTNVGSGLFLDTGADPTMTITGNTGLRITLDARGDADDTTADTFDITLNGARTEVRSNSTLILDQLTAGLEPITILGSGDDDTLNVDFTNGDPAAAGIAFDAGGQDTSDTLALLDTSASVYTTITHAFTNANDGTVSVDGSTITYTGLEPITDNLDAINRIFAFNGGVETITLADDATAGDGISTVDSTLGELVTFVNPTTSLTLDASAGTGGDIINLTSIDSLGTPANVSAVGTTDDDIFNIDINVETVAGNAGNDVFNLADNVTVGDAVTGISGGGGTDELVLVAVGAGPNSWTIDGLDSGNVGGQVFTDIDNLTGNANADTFAFSGAGTLSGVIAGGGAADVLDVSASNAGGGDDFAGEQLGDDGAQRW
jgi:filamentous hemagglutinin family protein